jgi:eukaryotic-like serine/threonine-protein kinase
MAELMYKIANEEAADIRTVRPDLSEAVAHVVALSLSKRPETRFQNGEQFASDLRLALADLAVGGTAPSMYTAPELAASPGMAADQTSVLAPAKAAGGYFEATRKIDTVSADFEKTVVPKPGNPGSSS